MKKLILPLLFSGILSAQTGKVGINTANPQATFHIDGKKDNSATGTPTAAQQANDFVITNTGAIGLGTTNPTTTMEIVADSAQTAASTAIEGIVIPTMSRSRVKSMNTTNLPEGTMVFVNDATGFETDATPGTAKDIDIRGLYYWSAGNGGNVWSKFETTAQLTDNVAEGMTVRKAKLQGPIPVGGNLVVECGRFKFQIHRYSSGEGSSRSSRVMWALRDGTTYNGTIRGAFRNTYATNQLIYDALARTFKGDTTDNNFLPLNNTATNGNANTWVDPNNGGTRDIFIGANDVFDIYLTYPGENYFYKVTFAIVQNSSGDSDDYNVISCNRY